MFSRRNRRSIWLHLEVFCDLFHWDFACVKRGHFRRSVAHLLANYCCQHSYQLPSPIASTSKSVHPCFAKTECFRGQDADFERYSEKPRQT
jgi:hypothetical protein